MLQNMNYTDNCIMTDLDILLKMDAGWHPSYIVIFDPIVKDNKIVLFQHNKDCHMNTSLTLTRNKQGFLVMVEEDMHVDYIICPEKAKDQRPYF